MVEKLFNEHEKRYRIKLDVAKKSIFIKNTFQLKVINLLNKIARLNKNKLNYKFTNLLTGHEVYELGYYFEYAHGMGNIVCENDMDFSAVPNLNKKYKISIKYPNDYFITELEKVYGPIKPLRFNLYFNRKKLIFTGNYSVYDFKRKRTVKTFINGILKHYD